MADIVKLLCETVRKEAAYAVNDPLGLWLAKNGHDVYAEVKYDGRRVFVFANQGKIVLATKHNGAYTRGNYPRFFDSLPKIPAKRAVLDAEFLITPKLEIRVFDVLFWDDAGIIKSAPFSIRRDFLERTFTGCKLERENFGLAEGKTVSGIEQIEEYKKDAIERGLEGIMLKNPNSSYGQEGSWLKMKRHDTLDVFVTGKVEGKDGFAFYVASNDQSGNRVELGKVGSFIKSVNPATIKEGDVLEIQFQEVTKEGLLRNPFALRIRTDKAKEECRFKREVRLAYGN